ncbi:MAG: RCC1 domain-containing protein [Bacteroidota bacterium]
MKAGNVLGTVLFALLANGCIKSGSPVGEADAERFGTIGAANTATRGDEGQYLERVVQVYAEGWQTCALTEDGSVYCWGGSDGLVEDGLRGLATPPARPYAIPAEQAMERLYGGRREHLRTISTSGTIFVSGGLASCEGPEYEHRVKRWLETFPEEVSLGDDDRVFSSRLLPMPTSIPAGARLLQGPISAESCYAGGETELRCIRDCGGPSTSYLRNAEAPYLRPGFLLDERTPFLSADGYTVYGGPVECRDYQKQQRGECDRSPAFEMAFESEPREMLARGRVLIVLDAYGRVSFVKVPQLRDYSGKRSTGEPERLGSFGAGITTIGLMEAVARVCAVREDATVECQHPYPAAPPFGPKTREVQGAEDIVQLSGGSFHMCGLRRDGRVMCWGLNTRGQLGNGGVLEQEVEQSHATFVVAPEGGQSDGPVVAHRMGYAFNAPGTTPAEP